MNDEGKGEENELAVEGVESRRKSSESNKPTNIPGKGGRIIGCGKSEIERHLALTCHRLLLGRDIRFL